jgi:hypothetical protein
MREAIREAIRVAIRAAIRAAFREAFRSRSLPKPQGVGAHHGLSEALRGT